MKRIALFIGVFSLSTVTFGAGNVTITQGSGGGNVTVQSGSGGGSGDIEGVTAGYGLTGGGTSGTVTLNLATDSTSYIQNRDSLQTGATFYVSSGSVAGKLEIGTRYTTPSFYFDPSGSDATIRLYDTGSPGWGQQFWTSNGQISGYFSQGTSSFIIGVSTNGQTAHLKNRLTINVVDTTTLADDTNTTRYTMNASSTIIGNKLFVSSIATVSQITWSDGTVQVTSPTSSGSGSGDNLGNHIATKTVTMAFGFSTSTGVFSSSITVTGSDVVLFPYLGGASNQGIGVSVSGDHGYTLATDGVRFEKSGYYSSYKYNGVNQSDYQLEFGSNADTLMYGRTDEWGIDFVDAGPTYVSGLSVNQSTGVHTSTITLSSIRFNDLDKSHYVSFRSSNTILSTNTYVLPSSSGTSNQVLAIDGSNNLFWKDDIGDNLGSHVATKTVTMGFGFASSSGTFSSTVNININSTAMFGATSGGVQLKAENIQFVDDDLSNFVALKSSDVLSVNNSYVLPASSGTSGQAIITDGSNNLSFARRDTFRPVFDADRAKLPAANPCVISNSTNATISSLLCDASTDESATWSTVLRPYAGDGLTADIYYTMASTNTGNIVHNLSVMCSTASGVDIDTENFGSIAVSTQAVPTTIGAYKIATVSLLASSCQENNLFILKYNRDADGTDDTASGDVEVRKIYVREP